MSAGKPSHEDFIRNAILRLRKDGQKGIHSETSSFSSGFRRFYPGVDPIAAVTELALEGKVAIRPTEGGLMLYINEEEANEGSGRPAARAAQSAQDLADELLSAAAPASKPAQSAQDLADELLNAVATPAAKPAPKPAQSAQDLADELLSRVASTPAPMLDESAQDLADEILTQSIDVPSDEDTSDDAEADYAPQVPDEPPLKVPTSETAEILKEVENWSARSGVRTDIGDLLEVEEVVGEGYTVGEGTKIKKFQKIYAPMSAENFGKHMEEVGRILKEDLYLLISYMRQPDGAKFLINITNVSRRPQVVYVTQKVHPSTGHHYIQIHSYVVPAKDDILRRFMRNNGVADFEWACVMKYRGIDYIAYKCVFEYDNCDSLILTDAVCHIGRLANDMEMELKGEEYLRSEGLI